MIFLHQSYKRKLLTRVQHRPQNDPNRQQQYAAECKDPVSVDESVDGAEHNGLFDSVQHHAGVNVVPRKQTNRTLEHCSSQQHQGVRQQHNHPHATSLGPGKTNNIYCMTRH
jgi:hypothetical protein